MFNTGGLTEAGSVTIANGKMETLGTTVEWYIRRVGDNEYVICPGENIHTYLSAETSTSSNIVMTYIDQSGIPSRCKWQISSNRLINVATGKYLGINGTTLTSYDSAGTAGTVDGDKRIWRINTKNNVTSQELISLEPRSVLTILDNEARLESYTTSAANGTAYYIGANDFTYSGLPAGVMTYSYSTHKFSFINYPSSQSVYTITMTHKVTGISNTFKVVAKPNIMLVAINDPSHSDQHDEYFDYVEACYDDNLIFNEYVDCTRGEILSNITNKYNNVFVSFCHGDSVGETTRIKLYGESYITGYDFYSGTDLSNMRLMIFVACKAGMPLDEGCYNLPQKAQMNGVDCAIGFEKLNINATPNQKVDNGSSM